MELQDLLSIEIKKDTEKALVSIKGVIPKEEITKVRNSTIERLGKEKSMNGFRKGHVPAEVIEKEIGTLDIWKNSAHEVIMKYFPEILAKERVVPLGKPNLQFTSIVDNADVSFELEFYTMPEVVIPDLKALKGEIGEMKEAEPAQDAEVEEVVLDVRKSVYKKQNPDKLEVPEDASSLPELTDENVKEVSHQHSSVESFLQHIRDSITREKKKQEKIAYRQKILDTLIKHTNIPIPENIIEEETKRGYADIENQAKTIGTTVEAFLEKDKMTRDQLMALLRSDAKKRSQVQLLLNAISTKEQIVADKEEVAKEVARFKDKKHDMSEEDLEVYLGSLLTNEAVVQFLEEQYTK